MPIHEKYQYSSVAPYNIPGQPKPQTRFRLLKLLPGAFPDDLSVTIVVTDLNHDQAPRYEALSYVWGLESDHTTIKVDQDYNLHITPNLEGALRHLRHESNSRTLWVDAVCINQDDLQERAQQVTLMGDIYRLAQQVIVWLGPEADGSALALDYLDSLSRRIVVNWWQGTIAPASWVDTPWIRDLPISFAEMPAELAALIDLFSRPWFERVWIRQEIFLARSAIVQCGQKHIPWESFKNSVFCLSNKGVDYGDEAERGPAFMERTWLIHALGRVVPLQLRNIMETSRAAQCKDARDKIYGVLNMLDDDDAEKMAIMPDYTRTTEEVYRDLVIRHISRQNSLDMLRSAGLPGTLRKLPTWVPDWTDNRNGRGVGKFLNAGGNLPPRFQLISEDILEVWGVAIARIAELFPCKTDLTTYEEYRTGFREAFPSSKLTAQMYEDEEEILDAYCRVLCFDGFRDKMFPDTGGQSFRHARTTLEATLNYDLDESEYISDAEQDLQDACHLASKNMCVSDKGHIGMVPFKAEIGDILCVAPGCASVLVLREMTAKTGHYLLVGDAYVDGVMNGEAILGPLPEGWVAVWRREAAEAYHHPFFLQTSKMRFTSDDPRLSTAFNNVPSAGGEVLDSQGKLMEMLPGMLNERGVQLTSFRIE